MAAGAGTCQRTCLWFDHNFFGYRGKTFVASHRDRIQPTGFADRMSTNAALFTDWSFETLVSRYIYNISHLPTKERNVKYVPLSLQLKILLGNSEKRIFLAPILEPAALEHFANEKKGKRQRAYLISKADGLFRRVSRKE